MTDDNDVDMNLFFTVMKKDMSAMVIEMIEADPLIPPACNVAAQNFAYPMLAVVWKNWVEVL